MLLPAVIALVFKKPLLVEPEPPMIELVAIIADVVVSVPAILIPLPTVD